MPIVIIEKYGECVGGKSYNPLKLFQMEKTESIKKTTRDRALIKKIDEIPVGWRLQSLRFLLQWYVGGEYGYSHFYPFLFFPYISPCI